MSLDSGPVASTGPAFCRNDGLERFVKPHSLSSLIWSTALLRLFTGRALSFSVLQLEEIGRKTAI